MTHERAVVQPDDEERLPMLFFLIVIVEAVTIAGLYWLGRHFGAS